MKNGSATGPPTENIAVAFGAIAVVCMVVRVGKALNGNAMFVGGQDPMNADAKVKIAVGLAGVPTIFADATC